MTQPPQDSFPDSNMNPSGPRGLDEPLHDGHVFGPGVSPEDEARLMEILRNVSPENPKELEPYGDEDDEFVVQLRNIAQRLGLGQDVSVIYPGSHAHAGVARVFGKEHVVHVDPDVYAMKAMREAGCHTVELPIEAYIPERPANLVVALNSYGKPTREVMDRLVAPGGYVVANNWTGWARDISGMKGYEMVGAVMPAYTLPEAKWVDSADLPDNPAGADTVFYKMLPGGALEQGTPEDNTFVDDEYRNTEALFVFQRKPSKYFSGIMQVLSMFRRA